MPRPPVRWLLDLALWLGLVAADPYWLGQFSIQRTPSSCTAVIARPLQIPTTSDNCLLYNFADLQQSAAPHATYVRGRGRRYRLRTATLDVKGRLGDIDLSFHCPTEEYYGTPAVHCDSAPGLQAAVLHVGEDDRLYSIDVVRSPAAYPPLDTLAAHQPPFGVAQLQFPIGIPLYAAQHLQVCPHATPTVVCGGPAAAVPPPQLSASYASLGGSHWSGFFMRTERIVDPANQLMVSAVGATRYYFNSAGFFLAQDQTCSAFTSKTFASQLGAYDARFLDHVGTVTVVGHASRARFKPVRVALWVGVAFDVDTIQPVVLFADPETGAERGMEAFAVARPPQTSGAFSWYDTVTPAVPGLAVRQYAERRAKAGDPCAHLFHDWLRLNVTRVCPAGFALRDGLCYDAPGQHALSIASDHQRDAVGPPLRWAGPAFAGLAGFLALGLHVTGRLGVVGGRRASNSLSPPHGSPAAYKTFDTL
eukprot:EG_transcript_8301